MSDQKSESEQNAIQAQAWIEKAIEALKAGDMARCIEHAKLAVAIDPGNARLWFRMGLFFAAVHRFDEALESYGQALKIDPKYGKVWFNRGLALALQKRYTEAIEPFDNAILLLPDDTEPAFQKGDTLNRIGEFQRAIDSFDQVLEMNEEHLNAWEGKGYAYEMLGEKEGSYRCYTMVTKLQPEYGNGWYNRGVSEEYLGLIEDAISSFDRAISYNPKNGLAWGHKGNLLYDKNDFADALFCYQRAAEFGIALAANGIARCNEKLDLSQGKKIELGEHEFQPGDVIERAFVVYDIKQGGMGTVYLCYDNFNSRPAVLKTFQNKFLTSVKSRRRFIEEGRTWTRLMKHPNIVECHGSFKSLSGRPYLLLEHVEGNSDVGISLRDWIAKRQLDLENVIHFAVQICVAMQFAQDIIPGFVHCDLKPENVLVTSSRIVKVTDFGLAKAVENEEDRFRGGTIPYMSPEQVQSLDLDQRSDIYSFGCILYEMLTGELVFPVSTPEEFLHCHVKVKPIAPSTFIKLPMDLNELVMKCLEKDRERRPGTFGNIADTLSIFYEQHTGRRITKVDVAPPQAYELANKAMSLHHLGSIEEGLALLSEAMQEPGSQHLWFIKGTMLFDLSRYQEALDAFEMFFTSNPDGDIALAGWVNRGNCLANLGRPEDALSSYDKALAINNNYYEAWLNKATTLIEMGRTAEAKQYIDDFLERDPGDRDFLFAKAGLLYDQQQYHECIDLLDKTLEIDPMFTHALNRKGSALLHLEKWEQALDCFDRFVEIENSKPQIWYKRALALFNLSQYDKASESLDYILALDPNYPDLETMREKIAQRLSRK